MYKKEAPISPAGPEHAKTRSRNYKLNKFTSEAIQQQVARSFDGSSFLFCLKGFKTTFTRHLTFHSIPIKNNREREREKKKI